MVIDAREQFFARWYNRPPASYKTKKVQVQIGAARPIAVVADMGHGERMVLCVQRSETDTRKLPLRKEWWEKVNQQIASC